MTETPDKDSPPPLRLSPPPKVGRTPGDGADAAIARRARADRSLVYWLTGLVFLMLGATAFAVFVFLPDWVAERQPVQAGVARGGTGSAAGALPAEPGSATANDPGGGNGRSAAAVPEARESVADATPDPEPATGPTRREPAVRQATPPTEPPAATSPPPVDPVVTAFNAAMTEGLDRLDQGDLARAQAAFELARSLRPESPEARDGLARVDAQRQMLAIADHRERAAAHEERERWGEAAAEYAAVLALDSSIRFAQEGRERSAARRDLSDRLESHGAHPDRLVADEVLEDARDALDEARQIDAPGPVLTRQIERLAAQVAVAETPIRVVLVSDGETDLLVFRVGRLGTLERQELELRPGSYTVVGTRSGYRDVRRTLEVAPGKGEITLTVRCEEKI